MLLAGSRRSIAEVSGAASSTFYETHGAAVRRAVAASLQQGPKEDPFPTVMREHLQLDPCSGEKRAIPGCSTEMLRLYFQFLRDNERLPRNSQLPLQEIRLVWETLLAFFGEEDLEQEKIDQVFRLIQRKMERGQIGQAWILLNIFDYQRTVRLDNERSLYLEEMALLFSRRQDDGQRTVSEELRQLLQQAAGDLGLLPRVAEKLAEELGIHLQLLRKDEEEQESWRSVLPEAPSAAAPVPPAPRQDEPRTAAADAEQPAPGDRLLSALCSRKWRPPLRFAPETDASMLDDLHSPEAVRIYCDSLIKGVYFLILITESTGYEEFLATFIEWLRELIGPEAMRVFSCFHAGVTLEEKTINESLEAMFTAPPMGELPALVTAATGEELAAAARSLLEECAGADLLTIAPGDYSLEGLLLDRVLELSVPRFDLGWRLHRLL